MVLSSSPGLSAQPRTEVRATAQTRATAQVERLLAQAERQVIAGRPARALPILRRAMRADRTDARAPLRIAELSLPAEPGPEHARPDAATVRGIAAARASLETYLASPPREPPDPASRARAESWRRWALALERDHAAVIDETAAAAGLQDAEAAQSLRRLAALAVLRDDLAAAQRALEAARRAMPQEPDVLGDLATVLLARGRAAEAASLYEAVVARRPGDLEALRDLAGARLAAGDAAAAVRTLDAIVRQLPDRADVRLDLARARLEAGDREGAASAAREAMAIAAADDVEPALVLGSALAGAGLRDEARGAFEEALRRRPGNPRALEALRALGD